jgi:hypothetical protein
MPSVIVKSFMGGLLKIRGLAIALWSFSLVASLLYPAVASTSTPATAKTSLTTCIDLATLKERISKNGTCRTPQEALANWRIVPDDSALTAGSTTKTLIICSNKANSPVTYQLIRAKCAKHMQTNRYTRSASLPAKPVISRVISLSHESASLALAADSATSTDAPITYYTISTSKGEVKKVHSWKDLTLTITGLRSSTSYTFTVSATNADGTSPLSAASLPVTTQIYIAPVQASVAAPALSCANGGACAVGDRGPGGGIVFYVSATGFLCGPTRASTCTYLEAAPTTGSSAWTDTPTAWSGSTGTVSTVSLQIGHGYLLTEAMLAQDSTAGKAGTLSRAYRGPNNLNDWYLPSVNELLELYGQRSVIGGFDATTAYWSSSQSSEIDAFVIYNGNQLFGAKLSAFYLVRPIRAGTTRTAPVFTLSSTSETLTARTSALSGYTISSTGGTITSYSISPSAPPGLNFNGSTGVLSGTPTETSAATTYTITGSNSYGSATATFRLRVTGDIGDIGPGGGKIFYVASTPFACGPTLNLMCRYLEAAPTTGTAAWDDFYNEYEWSGDTTTEIGTTGTAIGDGLKNTLAMVSLSSIPDKAGTISRAFRGPNNLTDWHLPSKEELNQLFVQKTLVGFFNVDYWSSSESAAGWAWSQQFVTGVSTQDAKNYPIKVRPIRAF